MNSFRSGVLASAAVGCVVAASLGVSPPGARTAALAAGAPAYSTVDVGPYGGEPSLVSDRLGQLYDSTPSGGTLTYTSTNSGATWSRVSTADPNSGDDCLATDQLNAVYLCNLAGSQGTAPLQADVWKSVDHGTTWTHGSGAIPQCATSCSPFGVDRDWVAASILPPATQTSQAEVVLMYHDFYGPSQIWVNISHDGGATFGLPQNVLASPQVTAGKVAGTLVAQGYTFCNTVPAGVGIAPPGTPHAGRIIVGWIASDLAQNATGCNVSMLQSFHTFWTSYSDDNGSTWTAQQAFDAGVGHDASTPFVGFTLDKQGNPYFGFAVNLNSNPAVCSAESTAGTVQTDTSCEYDMYVIWSSDGGGTWDGGGGLIPGSAGKPYRVNSIGETGTHFFPAIAAGNPGEVDVAYLRTSAIVPTDPFGKADPGGCAGPAVNPKYPGPCQWNLYGAQSLNLASGTTGASWAVTQITSTPMHVGDICNLGIACIPTVSNRNLLDFISETLDNAGCAHIAYADDNTVNKLRAANQIAGPCFTKPGAPGCHEGDGAGSFHGARGDADFKFNSDGCLDGSPDGVSSQDRGDGKDFQSTRIDSITVDDLASTLTVQGVGTSGGVPVAFVMVAVESTAVNPGSVAYTFSDGYANSGPLTSGSVSLH